jgi:hypothetical protein
MLFVVISPAIAAFFENQCRYNQNDTNDRNNPLPGSSNNQVQIFHSVSSSVKPHQTIPLYKYQTLLRGRNSTGLIGPVKSFYFNFLGENGWINTIL